MSYNTDKCSQSDVEDTENCLYIIICYSAVRNYAARHVRTYAQCATQPALAARDERQRNGRHQLPRFFTAIQTTEFAGTFSYSAFHLLASRPEGLHNVRKYYVQKHYAII